MLDRVLRWFGLERRSLGDPVLNELFGGGRPTSSGEAVSAERCLGEPVVWRCCSLISGSISSLPFVLYRRGDGDSRERYREHPLHDVLAGRPNPAMGATQYWETVVLHLLLRGNSYSSIVRDDDGRVRALWPLHPDRVLPEVMTNGRLKYKVSAGAHTVTVQAKDMLHIASMTGDGFVGRSVVTAAREAFGLALAERTYTGEVFSNGLSPRGTLTHPGRLSKEALARLTESLKANHVLRGRRHRTLILEEGAKFEPIGLSHEDAELVESRKLSQAELCMLFGVPPHLAGLDVKSSIYSNASYEGQHFLRFTLMPWLSRIQSAVNVSLIPALERHQMYAEHNVESLLEPTPKEKIETLALEIQSGILLVDEARRMLNLPALEVRAPSVA